MSKTKRKVKTRKRRTIKRRTVSRHARRHVKPSKEAREASKLAQTEFLAACCRLLTAMIDRYLPRGVDDGARLDCAELERMYRL